METILQTVLALSLAGTALGLLLMLINRFLGKRIYSGFVYYAWLLVLLRFILPVPGLLDLHAVADFPDGASRASAAAVSPPDERSGAESAYEPYAGAEREEQAYFYTGGAASNENGNEDEDTENGAYDAPRTGSGGSAAAFPFWLIGLCCWAAGAAGTAAWNIYGYVRYRGALYKTLRPAEECDMRVLSSLHPQPYPVLYRSGAADTPLLMGLLRPVIILPDRDYTPRMLEGILRHELTHYRRGDLAVKWFAAAVCCVHWFNPFTRLLRSSLDRACELSCDERLLHNMDKNEKQSYGELLLSLAANRTLPRQVVAVSFATEKRNLKERLVQIMTFRKKGFAAVSMMLALLVLLAGCAMAVGPASDSDADYVSEAREQELLADGEEKTFYADSVDSFLAALGSDRTIILREGTYDLTKASDYGGEPNDAYSWEEVYDGYELALYGLTRLNIIGEKGAESVSIVTQPRYANVIKFGGCANISVAGVTAGHTVEQGECCGGVLYFDYSDIVLIKDCVLYGCGTEGITANNCRKLIADGTTVKECSYGAVESTGSYDIRFINGKIFNCGLKSDGCYNLLDAVTTTGFVVYNTEIYGNRSQILFSTQNSFGTEMRGCRVHDNRLENMILITANPILIDCCSITDNDVFGGSWFVNMDRLPIDKDGKALTEKDLRSMEWAEYTESYDGPSADTAPVTFSIGEDGLAEYHITTVDELLSAIGSNRVIYIDADTLDISSANGYGGYGGANYFWQDTYDGPELVIMGVENLRLIGKGKDKTTIETLPRYADVLAFTDCRFVTVEDLTAGHIRDMGSCSGDVISYENCDYCEINGCGLFGCGVNGINAYRCDNLKVSYTEIYECSEFGAILDNCYNAVFEGCSIHDCGNDKIVVSGYTAATWDGKPQDTESKIFTSW